MSLVGQVWEISVPGHFRVTLLVVGEREHDALFMAAPVMWAATLDSDSDMYPVGEVSEWGASWFSEDSGMVRRIA